MIRINQLTISIFEPDQKHAIRKKAAQMLKIPEDGFRKLRILRRSIDARETDDIRYSYIIEAKLRDTFTGPNRKTEQEYIDRLKNRDICQSDSIPVSIPEARSEGKDLSNNRPVIIGAGPCGLFAAMTLCLAGLRPVVVERGKKAEERAKDVEKYFETGILDPSSNVQFGEGGAGLFSDGKLNTSIKDRDDYIRFVLETFVEFGAGEDILIDAKPHIGTDVLFDVIKNIRAFIEESGGEFLFETAFTGFETEDGHLKKALLRGKREEIPTDTVILATGHSARDTYSMLYEKGLSMEKKPFAVGVRIQHPQSLIDAGIYGSRDREKKTAVLGPAAYSFTHKCENGRSVYSFCMCPGGYVINSSSEEGGVCVNGMSYASRDSGAANAAVVVNIGPDDFPGDVLSGIRFQRELERKAYELAGGTIPYETFEEFKAGKKDPEGVTAFEPQFKGQALPADVRSILPAEAAEAVTEGVDAFSLRVKGYNGPEAVVAGIEARTSSPVRIVRDENHETDVKGLYAAGEGAGYAGGITSAAVDGIKTAVRIIENYNRS